VQQQQEKSVLFIIMATAYTDEWGKSIFCSKPRAKNRRIADRANTIKILSNSCK